MVTTRRGARTPGKEGEGSGARAVRPKVRARAEQDDAEDSLDGGRSESDSDASAPEEVGTREAGRAVLREAERRRAAEAHVKQETKKRRREGQESYVRQATAARALALDRAALAKVEERDRQRTRERAERAQALVQAQKAKKHAQVGIPARNVLPNGTTLLHLGHAPMASLGLGNGTTGAVSFAKGWNITGTPSRTVTWMRVSAQSAYAKKFPQRTNPQRSGFIK
ncbi:hypothetical protein FVE85_6749 [Porphyridium purpureum]|uniref:Uncharacterized protein n=1 Tax=Porphyridium purpureum TaxID=35688 RepID=A0A5J4Z824_PORPP|nr:hypothetical protein FVE85_6749 [Porphyridium purpureum]|eukprot:POR1056..scf295_1